MNRSMDFDFGFLPTKDQHDNINSTSLANRDLSPSEVNFPMDGEQGRARLPAASSTSAHIEPLHLRKPSSQAHLMRSQPPLTEHNSNQNVAGEQAFPTRISSIREHSNNCGRPTFHPYATRINPPSPLLNSDEFSIAPSSPSTNGCYAASNTSPPTILSNSSRHLYPIVLSNSARFLSETSSAIMGDFVPIDSPNMAGLQPDINPNDDALQGTFRPFRAPKINPYEFEPSTPFYNLARQTTFNDYIMKGQEAPSPRTARSGHFKNARSEENAMRITQTPVHLAATPIKLSPHSLHKSESSPNISQLPFPPHRKCTPGSEVFRSYTEAKETDSPARRSFRDFQDSKLSGDQNIGRENDSRCASRRHLDFTQHRQSRSPVRHTHHATSTKHKAVNRNMTQSPTKILDDVSERDERNDNVPGRSSNTPPSTSPRMRSRSPMKKMFGENGWLGKSPAEKSDLTLLSKKGFITHTGFAHRPKKFGMMEKLKSKFEEIAEKADLGSMGHARSNSDTQTQAVLAISLGPPEQARIYMEVELMLVHTANSFLMNQFSHGRMDIDSIKKTVEAWKNKGRPVVIEFMYDQATQRDLVVANQQNFRFHGDNAGSAIRINSMLYNWKQVAQLLLIRTFCNADPVIMKLLFDIEQILGLLGAVEPMMIRLQQIRATATEMLRLSRQSKDSKASSQRSFRGRDPPRNSESSSSRALNNMDELYGGLKLVPDSYKE